MEMGVQYFGPAHGKRLSDEEVPAMKKAMKAMKAMMFGITTSPPASLRTLLTTWFDALEASRPHRLRCCAIKPMGSGSFQRIKPSCEQCAQ